MGSHHLATLILRLLVTPDLSRVDILADPSGEHLQTLLLSFSGESYVELSQKLQLNSTSGLASADVFPGVLCFVLQIVTGSCLFFANSIFIQQCWG